VGSRFVACSYFEIAPSILVTLSLSPSLARLTASMLFRLQAEPKIANADRARTVPRILFMAAGSVRERVRYTKRKSQELLPGLASIFDARAQRKIQRGPRSISPRSPRSCSF